MLAQVALASQLWVLSTHSSLSVQTVGAVPVHVKPASTAHVEEQPSPFAVLPSSQPSAPTFSAFPQALTVQFASQPSPLVRLPSSQASVGSAAPPLPQVERIWRLTL